MKIAHVVDSMEVGGAETLVEQMCHRQREQGHVPAVFALAALGAIGERMRGQGFSVRAELGRHLPGAVRGFARIFRELRPDVVHLHNPTPAIYAALPARWAGAGCVVSTRHSLVAPPRRIAQEIKYAAAALACDWIAGVCQATASNLRAMHTIRPHKIVCIYNGVAPLRRVPAERRPPSDGLTLVYVGRLEPVKNHVLLLEAFRIALTRAPELRLWMVGDGSQRSRLEDRAAGMGIANRVTFWGQQADVAPFFSGAGIFIMSSRSEGLPTSLLQGFSLGLPAIVTDVGGMAEAVRTAEAGLIVPPAEAEPMAAAITQLAKDGVLRRRFSENAASAFARHFSLERMLDAYMNLYQRPRRF